MSEKSINENVGYSVNRGLDEYGEVFGMTRNEMFDWLGSKKKVLDIGSGGGLLQKEVNLLRKQGLKSNVQIFSMDIIYGSKSGEDFSKYSTHLAFTHLNRTPTKSRISEINNLFNSSAVGGSFTKLPFADKSFDGILASYSFGIHSESKEQILHAYGEVERVLKSGGEARISVIFDSEKNIFRTIKRTNPVIYSLADLPFPQSNIRLEKSNISKELDVPTNNYLVINKE